MDTQQQRAQARDRAMRNTSIAGAVVNLAMTVAKIFFGFVGHSQSLIADGIHSLADLSTDLMVWFAAKYSNQPADQDHPYGHARIETVFTVALGSILLITAFGIAVDSVQRIINPDTLLIPTPVVMVVAVISILSNEGLYQYTMRVARDVKSGLLIANAWHHRSDAISSVIVLIGVAGSLMGMPYLDAFAALGVAVMIGKVGWDQGWSSIRELIDTGLEPKTTASLERIIENIEGVQGVHKLRSRRMGSSYLIDVHIEVEDRLSVSEGHMIAEYVRLQLIDSDKDIAEALVHIDPEDDALALLCETLPLRREVIRDLSEVWSRDVDTDEYRNMTLHYLSGKVHVDLLRPMSAATDAHQLEPRLQEKAQALHYIGQVRVFYYSPEPQA